MKMLIIVVMMMMIMRITKIIWKGKLNSNKCSEVWRSPVLKGLLCQGV